MRGDDAHTSVHACYAYQSTRMHTYANARQNRQEHHGFFIV